MKSRLLRLLFAALILAASQLACGDGDTARQVGTSLIVAGR